MRTQSQKTLDLVARLNEIIEARKQIEREEKDLKTEIKSLMGQESILEAGSLMVLVESRSRTDLDRKGLMEDFGADVMAKYIRTSSYEILSIKPLKREASIAAG